MWEALIPKVLLSMWKKEELTFLGRRTVSDNIKPDSGRRGCGAGSDPGIRE